MHLVFGVDGALDEIQPVCTCEAVCSAACNAPLVEQVHVFEAREGDHDLEHAMHG